MAQSWKYAVCVLALAACSEKQSSTTTSQPTTGRPETTSKTSAADTAATVENASESLHLVAVAAAEVPAAQKLPGKLLEAWRWQDSNGENLLVVYRKEIPSRDEVRAQKDPAFRKKLNNPQYASSAEDMGRGAQLQVRQYVRKNGIYTELWRLQDGVSSCPVDLILGPAKGSTTVTDLDHNGQSETTFLYALGCRGDMSPDEFKLVMHDGAAKYALRGTTVVSPDSVPSAKRQPVNPCCLDQLSKKQLAELDETPNGTMGRYFTEAEFKDKPEFIRFARRQWQKYSVFDAQQASVD